MQSMVVTSYESDGVLSCVEVPTPDAGPGQVRIRIEATALGFVDGLMVRGRYQIRPDLPYVPGGEIAGVVDAVGAGVKEVQIGDRVVTWQPAAASLSTRSFPPRMSMSSGPASIPRWRRQCWWTIKRPTMGYSIGGGSAPLTLCWCSALLEALDQHQFNWRHVQEQRSLLRHRPRKKESGQCRWGRNLRSTIFHLTGEQSSGRRRQAKSLMSSLIRLAATCSSPRFDRWARMGATWWSASPEEKYPRCPSIWRCSRVQRCWELKFGTSSAHSRSEQDAFGLLCSQWCKAAR